jgi:hypothetical protein
MFDILLLKILKETKAMTFHEASIRAESYSAVLNVCTLSPDIGFLLVPVKINQYFLLEHLWF